ncbi:Yip1 domain protein [uncultured archaeon]|nr:Yip1 domain protein [uncultured archaeon]
MDLKSYPKEYARITLASIKTPAEFFQGMSGEGRGYLKPLAYMLVSGIIYNIGIFLGFFVYPESISLFSSAGFFLTAVLSFLLIIFSIIQTCLYIGLMHLAVLIVGGKAKFNDTFKVVCYSFSPLNFAWIFGFGTFLAISFKNMAVMLVSLPLMMALFVCLLYIYYIEVIGLSVTSGITRLRAFAAVLIQLFIYTMIVFILLMVLVLFFMFTQPINYSYSPAPYNTQSYGKYSTDIRNYEIYNTTVYAGSTPQIDGIVDTRDAWYEGEKIYTIARGKNYNITTKHDFENIYILMEWEGPPEWEDMMALYFEQDGSTQDFTLTSGLADNYYQGHYKYGPDSFRDAHYDSGYTVSEVQNGNLKSSYTDGSWKLEWQIPMKSGDEFDIYIDTYPTQVGFSILNDRNGASGIWPPSADMYDPKTWGSMTIVDGKKI